jgi:L-asparaginase II
LSELVIEQLRGQTVESRHLVSVAVTDSQGRLIACSGDPHLITFMRSAAKPFQALPLIEDGAAERFAVSPQEIALACASHNSEPYQVELVRAFLERIGLGERDLACGPHRPLSADLAIVDADGAAPHAGTARPRADSPSAADRNTAGLVAPRSPLASNCSGKHAAMLALARHHGWPTPGYHLPDHPVQERCRQAVSRWVQVTRDSLSEAVDGCGVVTFALPLSKMAVAYAKLATSEERAAVTVVQAMTSHPDLVAGKGRSCTALLERYPGRVLAKVGAEGVYAAALLDRAIGIALKVEDGHNWSAVVALLAVLDQLGLDPSPNELLSEFARLPIRNTRGEIVGHLRASGRIRRV